MKKKFWLSLVAVMLLGASSALAAEEAFPSRTITFVHGFGAGGGIDILARMALMKARPLFKVPAIVSGMPGGATVEAMKYVQKQPADGYTVFVATPTSIFINPLCGRVDIKPEDWQPILRAHIDVSSWMVTEESPYKKWEDLLKYAKENPGKLKVGIMGALSVDAIASAALANQAGIEVKMIPFDGGGEGMAALLGGHVDVLFEEPGVVMQLVEAKKVRPLLLMSDKRIDRFADVECAGDFGYKGIPLLWRGFFVKAGTPADRVKVIEDALTKSMQSDLYKAYENESLLRLYPGGFVGSAEFAEIMKTEVNSYADVMKQLGYVK